MRSVYLAAALTFAALTTGVASAHPKLVAATPAASSSVAAPSRVQLRFSERLMPRFTGAELVMTGMPGMTDHPPMKVASNAAVAADGHTLVVTPARALPRGTYRVDWYVVSADTHRITGTHIFEVK